MTDTQAEGQEVMEQEQIETHKTIMGSESGSFNIEQTLKEFSSGVDKCAGWVHKTSISSMDEKAMEGVLNGIGSVLAGGSFQVSACGSIPLHGLDDHYFGLRFGEIYRDDDCVHGDIEASLVLSVENGECTSATLTIKDDDGSILMERRLDNGLTSAEVDVQPHKGIIDVGSENGRKFAQKVALAGSLRGMIILDEDYGAIFRDAL